MGRIGQAMARRGLGILDAVLYDSTHPVDFPGAELASKERILAESDFLSIHVPLTAKTRHPSASRNCAQ